MSAKTIALRTLGKDGPSVPAIGYGLMGMSVAYGTAPSDEERFAILDRAVELGDTFWDTADLYGDNHALLGKYFKLRGNRDKIFLSTKFGYRITPPIDFKNLPVDTSADWCKEACSKALETLGTDHIDLYWVHRINPKTPIEVTMRALAELKAEGKIKYVGLSGPSSATLRRAHKILPVSAVQAEYSAFVLDVEGEAGDNMLATCRELGVALVPYSPLGRGLITTTFAENKPSTDPKDMRASYFPRFSVENRDANVKIINQLQDLAATKGCTVSQLAIAWLLKQGEDIIPIPGTKKLKYLEENWAALDVHLTDADEIEIREFVTSSDMQGNHNPQGYHKKGELLVDTVEES